MKFTFDNHSRSVDKAREVVQGILGDNLVSVNPGTNDVRVSVETVRNITGEQQNSIAKALSQLPKVAEAANIPAKKVEAPAVVIVTDPPVVAADAPVIAPTEPVVETPVVETPVVESPTEPEAPVPAPTHVVVVPGT